MSRSRSESGFSLVEAIVAVFVLSIGILALARATGSTVVSLRDSRERQTASNAASSTIEEARSWEYDQVAMRSADVSASDRFVTTCGSPAVLCFDPDGPGGVAPEPIVTTPGARLTDHERVEDGFTVYTFVTWYDDPAVPGTTNARRVTTVVASPNDPDDLTRQSTLVANAKRGLDLPKFEVSPQAKSKAYPATAPATCPAPVDHSLQNLGERDRYDIWITGAGYTTSAFTPSELRLVKGGRDWRVTIYIDHDLDGTYEPAELFRDQTGAESDGTVRPDANQIVTRGANLPLRFCYEAKHAVTNGQADTFSVAMRSAFDPNVNVTLTHDLNVGTPASRLYLHHSGNNNNRLYSMDATAPTATSSTAPDFDNGGIPGLSIEKQKLSDNKRHPIWDNQVTVGSATLSGTAKLQFYSAWDNAAKGANTSNDSKSLTYRLVLQKVKTTGNNPVVATLYNATWSYNHSANGFVQTPLLDLNFTSASASARTFAQDEQLRLRILCDENSSTDCHIAFDRTNFPAYLEVQ